MKYKNEYMYIDITISKFTGKLKMAFDEPLEPIFEEQMKRLFEEEDEMEQLFKCELEPLPGYDQVLELEEDYPILESDSNQLIKTMKENETIMWVMEEQLLKLMVDAPEKIQNKIVKLLMNFRKMHYETCQTLQAVEPHTLHNNSPTSSVEFQSCGCKRRRLHD